MRAGARPPPSSTSKPGAAPMEDEVVDPTCRAPGLRKKAIGVRPWLLIDASGQAQVVEAGKHSIMRRTGLPARDLRILDPLLSYPSTVLGRERAIVINLEHIKAIITAQEVLLLNSKDPSVIPFIDELQLRFSRLHQATKNQEGRTGSGGDVDWNAQDQRSRMASPLSSGSRNSSGDFQRFHQVDEKGKGDLKAGFENGPRVLPFEFIALEACLEAACSCLDNEARTLEQEAHPALDKLTSKISTLNLERVRQIKSRLVAITGRVQKVRDELEHLLDDDEDMAEMYLTDKLMQQHLDGSSVSSLNDRDGIDDSVLRSDVDAKRYLLAIFAGLDTNQNSANSSTTRSTYFYANLTLRAAAEIFLAPNDVINNYEADDSPDHLLATPDTLNGDSHRTHTTSSHSSSKHLDVEELEMLLEAYFVQIDGTLNNLSTLREYVDDTEDYINIMLDDKQNHLLQMGVMLTTATLVVSAFVVVAALFGMNIDIELFDKTKAGMPEFLWTIGGGATGSIFLYIIAIAWCKHKRLLE